MSCFADAHQSLRPSTIVTSPRPLPCRMLMARQQLPNRQIRLSTHKRTSRVAYALADFTLISHQSMIFYHENLAFLALRRVSNHSQWLPFGSLPNSMTVRIRYDIRLRSRCQYLVRLLKFIFDQCRLGSIKFDVARNKHFALLLIKDAEIFFRLIVADECNTARLWVELLAIAAWTHQLRVAAEWSQMRNARLESELVLERCHCAADLQCNWIRKPRSRLLLSTRSANRAPWTSSARSRRSCASHVRPFYYGMWTEDHWWLIVLVLDDIFHWCRDVLTAVVIPYRA